MSVLYACGSPKPAGASRLILEAVRSGAPGVDLALTPCPPPSPGGWDVALDASALVLSFPLYVDHLPAPLLECLESLGEAAGEARRKEPGRPLPALYAAVNNGFFEATHCAPAAAALRLFCRDSGFRWHGALMAGGGPVMSSSPGLFRAGIYPFGRIRRALASFAALVRAFEPAGETFVDLPMPRRAYVFMANGYWRALALRNRVPLRSLYGPALGPEAEPPSGTRDPEGAGGTTGVPDAEAPAGTGEPERAGCPDAEAPAGTGEPERAGGPDAEAPAGTGEPERAGGPDAEAPAGTGEPEAAGRPAGD